MKRILVTNNPKVNEEFSKEIDTIYMKEKDFIKVLELVRDKIHGGHKLLTHPLSSSIKPNETPYKSVLISKEVAKLDMESLMIIENSLESAKKLINDRKTPNWTESILEDFQVIDLSIIKSAI
ncbi:GrdX family protein [Anaeromicrobium sediminis]|uniref:GrdX protein n=1 Tax=Anaeromicrobium sediminis TaxID=1478221 RepID=A0A267MMG2_9FIRM|nr:GrdX family protein [Anaeromicrobium sediminis]PAB60791.1 GrdX protein [Anaeromicrobium sediminis]